MADLCFDELQVGFRFAPLDKVRITIDGLGFVTLSILLLTDKEEISTVGTAIGVLPLRGGRAVPYPFERKAEYAVLQLPADD
ncbi:MAG: hypothetical protein NT071_14285 [Burkholderiales bacterium]|nr:hypothetical protein [Burkholderiales bacterium]